MSRPRCFFDISIDNNNAGRIVFELYNDINPKQLKISELYALEKKVLDTKNGHSTEPSLNL